MPVSKELLKKMKKLKCERCGELLIPKEGEKKKQNEAVILMSSMVCYGCQQKERKKRHKKLGIA
jgi:RNase P subunit RPR2